MILLVFFAFVLLYVKGFLDLFDGVLSYNIDKENSKTHLRSGAIELLSVVLLLIFLIHDAHTPTAMDVYQGKTTIEKTYRNGVAVDSTIVFLDKK